MTAGKTTRGRTTRGKSTASNATADKATAGKSTASNVTGSKVTAGREPDTAAVRWWPIAVVAGFGVVWLAGTIASLVGVLGDYDSKELAVAAPVTIVLSLSILLIGGTLTGAGAGLAARTLAARRGATLDRPLRRLVVTGGGGAIVALATGGAVYAVLGRMPASPAVVAAVVAATALAGGCLAVVRQPAYLLAGMVGTAGMLVVRFVLGWFTSPLSRLFGGEKSLAEVALGHERLALASSVAAGIAAGYLGYRLLRGTGQGIAAHVAAGATAGIVSLFAEGVTFLAGPAVLGDRAATAAGGVSAADELALQVATQSRINGALIVAFTGAIIAVFFLGRTRKPAKRPDPREEALKAYEQRQRAKKAAGPTAGKPSGAAKRTAGDKGPHKTSGGKTSSVKTGTHDDTASKNGTRVKPRKPAR